MPPHDAGVSASDPVAAGFARWSAGLTWEALPEGARRIARLELLDFAGDAIAGRAAVGMPAWLAFLMSGRSGEGTTVVGGHLAPAWSAATANGYFGHVLELDDTHDVAVLHAGASAIPAALAAAQYAGGVSGARFMAAIAAGMEMSCRLGVATDLSLVEGGWIYSALLGHFGAALAASHVLASDARTTAHALAIAYSHTCGNHQSSREGATTKHLQPGIAAGNGVTSALMAARGLAGPDLPFTGEDGFARVYLHGRFDAERATRRLGETLEIERLSFKPYPSCRLTHPAISAALALRAQLGGNLGSVTEVRLRMGRQAFDVVGRAQTFRLRPQRWLDAQFSVFWTVAAALQFGEVTPRRLLAEVPPGEALASWIDRIRAEELPGSALRDVGACEIEATGSFGTVTVRAGEAKGHPDNPLSEDEVVQKFVANVDLAGIDGDEAHRLARELLAIDAAADVGAIVRAWSREIRT